MSESNTTSIQGLSSEEVIASRTKNGANSTEHQQKNNFTLALRIDKGADVFITTHGF